MSNILDLNPKNVFKYFSEICSIPHGSGNMEKISQYCMDFAQKHGLRAVRDAANNVIIYKNASPGYEDCAPVILQGHLDMVCQKTDESDIDFECDGLELFLDGDYIGARGTTLGADNGIAVAMMLAILEDTALCHPPVEAVFTTDEEVGMLGAVKLDMSLLSGRRMINMDSEDPSVVTVSCAGGSDFSVNIPVTRRTVQGSCLEIRVSGLRGGHSGVEINSGAVNANILMARILNKLYSEFPFDIVSIDGGDKGNAITPACCAKIVCENADGVAEYIEKYAALIKEEISSREKGFSCTCNIFSGNFDVLMTPDTKTLIRTLLCVPNGVIDMSMEIAGLVETSLNLGILMTGEKAINLSFALRSNKMSALKFLEEKMCAYFSNIECDIKTGGSYPPWEYKNDSALRDLYCEKYAEKYGTAPTVEAIHAGLECGVFSAVSKDFDCISIGPEMHGIHTVNERLSVSSTAATYDIVLKVLSELK